jgi:S-adenosylmethionine-diacylgycerolhomoserine-N-methlytransferase
MTDPGTDRHGALMDRVYRRQRHIYDLTRKYYLFGRDRLIRELDLAPNERLVEIGCGTARNLIAIARRYPEAQLFGIDASSEMLDTARQAVARAGLSHRIALVHGYAEELTPRLLGVPVPLDRAIFPYSLSMIPNWRRAIAAAAAALGPDGRLHIVDFGDLAGMGRAGSALLRAWLRKFHVEPRTEILGAIEGVCDRHATLWVSPGRYAFLWNCSKNDCHSLISPNVAVPPQALGNPGPDRPPCSAAVDMTGEHPSKWRRMVCSP